MKTTENTANCTFAPHSVTCNGQEFATEYSINPASKAVFAFLTVQEDGRPVKLRLRVEPSEAEYPAILAAAQQERDEREAAKQEPAAVKPVTVQRDAPQALEAAPVVETTNAEKPAAKRSHKAKGVRPTKPPAAQHDAPQAMEPAAMEPAAVKPVTVQQDAPQALEAVPVVEPVTQKERDPKQARGPIPEKSFIGLEIKGNGWKILFDGSHERTRVIFGDKPSAAAKATVEKAGFYWSPVLQSWNKKLTFKAYRAAQALALDLRAVCG